MSYKKVQSLSIKKDGTISMRCASSETLPITYQTIELRPDRNDAIGSHLREVFDNLADGHWEMNLSNKSLVYFCFLKAIEKIEQQEDILISHRRPLMWGGDSHRHASIEDYHRDILHAFQMYLLSEKKVNLTARQYAVRVGGNKWIKSATIFGANYSHSEPKYFTIVQAMTFSRLHNGQIVEKTD